MSYQERLEIFCVECEMGEGRLKNQQLFAADLKQLLADARCRRRKASRVPLETELVLARAEVARLREIVGDSLIDPNKVLKLVAKDRDDLLQEVARLREALTKIQKHAEGMWSELVDSGFADASTVPAFRMYAEKSSQVKS